MNQHSLQVLEFDLVRKHLASRCGTPYGAEEAQGLSPSSSAEVVGEEQALTAEARRLLESGVGFEFSAIKDIRPALEALSSQGAFLEPLSLLALHGHLRLARLIRTGLEMRRDGFPLLFQTVEGIRTFKELEEQIERSIEPEGRVADRASPALARIRREQENARERIHRKLEDIIAGSAAELQEPLVTMREGRYVVPVRMEARARFKGIVHDTSASGATAFVEPLPTVELNNQLRQLRLDEQREVERILRELSARALAELEPIRTDLAVIARLDLVLARGLLAAAWGCAAALPSISHYIKLVQARHPALERPVPLDLELGDGRTTAAITGPNTGGKTVVLKTVGLLALMNQAGLQVPAGEGSSLPCFDDVYADIGDEQSIAQSLSTFSSHLTRIVQVLGAATGRSLVLLDEVGAGTEPGEGAALAMAVLAELTGRGALVLATTHYGALKAFVQSREAMTNAAMEFDREALRPTYRLQMGLPGASFGLEIAARLGLPERLVHEARGHLDARAVQLEDLIGHIETVKRELEEQRDQAQHMSQQAEARTVEYREKLKAWKAEEQQLRQQAAREAEDLLGQARSAAEQAVALIKTEQASKGSIKQSRQILAEARERLEAAAPKAEALVPVASQALELSVGQEVYLPMTKNQATVVELPDKGGKLKVQAGSVRMTVRRDQVQPLATKDQAQTLASYGQERSFPPELHLLGMRADEALEALDRYLDEAVVIGMGQVRIVHGKGTGALRKVVKEALSKDSRVKAFRLGQWNEGQDGVTVAELK